MMTTKASNNLLSLDDPIDAVIDLGAVATRYKDLFLSGGVHLGGTGAANKLDDYEEGVWTPASAGFTVGNGTAEGWYTKVGNKVTVFGLFTLGSTSAITGNLAITGAPFSSDAPDVIPGAASLLDQGSSFYLGTVVWSGGTPNHTVYVTNSAAANNPLTSASPTVPFTWAATDVIAWTATYYVA